ncbi:pentatricopeptide repeat-containing protein At3g53170-like [Zingiber officinale]|uniref:pentatricopeptide repeat-containing protein At3g53170-like n=2 Tax=Zingiber officinale TaxID=94328 RepID=UPI001C4B9DB2|nr:pentatricopeptide repeat-containing protein At3g53170-like [Zingiber officinale]
MVFALLLLILQWAVGMLVLILCFVERRRFSAEIVSKLGSSFSLAPFIIVVAVCTLLAMVATLPVAQLFFFHILLIKKGISTYDYIIALRKQDQEQEQLAVGGQQSPQMSQVSSFTGLSSTSSFNQFHRGAWCTPPRLFLEDQMISQRNFSVRAAKRRRNARKGPQQNARLDLSRILRTEAAVLGVERKAGSAKFTRLWPRAVLEALDNSISANQWESALKIFGLVRRQHWYQPISRTYARLLTMLGKCRQPDHATSLFRVMLSEGLKPTLDVYTSLVGAYGHSGLLDKAISTLEEMNAISDCEPDAHTYTVLISSCCKLRRFELIPQLLMEMSYLGIEPNTVTHNTIIDGYGKARMLEEMESHLSTMLETGKCLPDIYTMNSMIKKKFLKDAIFHPPPLSHPSDLSDNSEDAGGACFDNDNDANLP